MKSSYFLVTEFWEPPWGILISICGPSDGLLEDCPWGVSFGCTSCFIMLVSGKISSIRNEVIDLSVALQPGICIFRISRQKRFVCDSAATNNCRHQDSGTLQNPEARSGWGRRAYVSASLLWEAWSGCPVDTCRMNGVIYALSPQKQVPLYLFSVFGCKYQSSLTNRHWLLFFPWEGVSGPQTGSGRWGWSGRPLWVGGVVSQEDRGPHPDRSGAAIWHVWAVAIARYWSGLFINLNLSLYVWWCSGKFSRSSRGWTWEV